MAWKFDIKGETLTGARQLKIGTFNYLIKGYKLEAVKADPTGKQQQVVLDLLQGPDYLCKVYLRVMSPNEQEANIADKTIRSIALAAGVKQLTSLPNKTVSITAIEKEGTGANKGKTFVNISTVQAADEGEEETEEEETPTPKSKKPVKEEEPEEESEEEEEEAEEEEAPAPKKTGRPW